MRQFDVVIVEAESARPSTSTGWATSRSLIATI
jgi:hypothetical protein